ncbi:uncharacterized protein LOC143571081 [Bidens hawaiensis]|uniref:uncharacterized protein LOC143571078 n=1 Tax=Bidens hawaiensis TaxID=980011 RepID=UPI00404B5294
MENNGLNINRPLLSVRRFSSISSSRKIENRKNESQIPVRSPIESCKSGSTSKTKVKSGSVPFGWEHSPGRPKSENNKQIQIVGSPKVPAARLFKRRNKISKPECSKSTKKQSSGSPNDAEEDNNDSGEAYIDALDTPSSGGTSFNNCSSSGLGGTGSDVKPSGLIRADLKVKDFMLSRFLPAARAMASDAPQLTPKKIAVKEKKSVNMDNNHNGEEDDYDSDYEYREHGPKSSKFCGLIPRFRSANGACIKAKLPIFSACRTQASCSSSCSFRETVSEPARSGEYKHRSWSNVLKIESSEPANLEGSKLYNRLQGPLISVDHSGSIQSTVSEQSDSSSKKKGTSFRELLADKKKISEITETDSQDSIFEKTLYVDTVYVAESPKENSMPSCTKPQSSFSEPLESDESKHDMKTSKCKGFDYESEWFDDDVKGNLKLKGYETKSFENPAPPPLPKKPSDSWLCRTLPSVSSKKANTLWIPI